MKKLVVYFHGYGSSANTDKVARLKAKHEHVYAWDIDIDPSVSIPMLVANINDVLVTNMHDEAELVFVGTSLGGWYASVLAEWYDARAFIINPCFDPANSLVKFDVSADILAKYLRMPVTRKSVFVIARDDELLDFTDLMPDLVNNKVTVTETGGHRFNGPEFEDHVVSCI